MGTISTTVQHRKERIRQKQVRLDELTQRGSGDPADYFHDRDIMYRLTELKV
jgi:hypothetical protein